MDISRTRFGSEDGPETERIVAWVETRYLVIHDTGAELFASKTEAMRAINLLLRKNARPRGPIRVDTWTHCDRADRFGPYIREDEFLRVIEYLTRPIHHA